jgi:Protein of unknown function (DUF1559)
MRILQYHIRLGAPLFVCLGFACSAPAWAQKPPDQIRREQILKSIDQLKAIALALYKTTEKDSAKAAFPAGYSDAQGQMILSWRVAILPALGERALFDEFRLDEPWDSEHNQQLIRKMPDVYKPVRGDAKAGHTYYRGFTGEQAMFPTRSSNPVKVQVGECSCYPVFSRPLNYIKDGNSNTLLIAEGEAMVPWTKPEELAYDPKQPLLKLGGQFDGDFNGILCDNSTRFFPRSIPEPALRAFITPNGREQINLLEFGGLPESGEKPQPAKRTLPFPLPPAAQAAAQRNESMNNLKQIALGILNYEDLRHRLPTQAIFNKEGKPLLSWRVSVLPQIGAGELYQQFHLDEPWDSEHNKKLIEKMPDDYKSPGSKAAAEFKTVYLTVRGDTTPFPGRTPVQLSSITDGTASTIMLVEASDDKAVVWTKPDDFEPDVMNPIAGLVGLRTRGFLAAFCDGHVDTIPQNVDPEDLKALFTRNGREPVDLSNLKRRPAAAAK